MAMRAASTGTIQYTYVDEAPMLATYSLLPVIKAYCKEAGISVERPDISLSGRIIAHFPEKLTADQKIDDELAKLGDLAKTPGANIIKLPNISASLPQLEACIAELQEKGYAVPNYADAKETYAKVLGSAVNPVLREGNSDRRVAAPVKAYAQKNPKERVPLGPWTSDSKCHVATMSDGDFYSSEQSVTLPSATDVRIEFVAADGTVTVMKDGLAMQAGEVMDSSCMNATKLAGFFEEQFQDAKEQGILASLHLKATMMKVSDPIMFGHAVKVYYKDAFAKHGALFAELGANPNNGIGDIYAKIAGHPKEAEVTADLEACYASRPGLAMVDSRKGITNLHVPSDVIIDASMPNVIRDSGKMWNAADELEDCKAIVPDRSYGPMYEEVVKFCKANGAFDDTTMGSVANVGLMAQKAEEYGSHDKTFEVAADGVMRVVKADGTELMSHNVQAGDIWRACQSKDAPIKDWVKLAVTRARASGSKAIFWLDENRAHDRSLIAKVNEYMPEHDTTGLDIAIMPPVAAIADSMARAKAGKDTISVTGNVLRDYLTDLFPIIELGTSAKMLSIVPLLAGGGLFETGAGGSAPKHVEQLLKENHLRWDSLGEFLALAVSIEDLAAKTGSAEAKVLADTLNTATSGILDNGKSPSRRAGEIDNRGSHFYLALYWAQALAAQTDSPALAAKFGPLAETLSANEATIAQELIDCQGPAADVGGYFRPVDEMAYAVMRPSATFNAAIDSF
jgi:isocitrate dehydrogenase